MLTTNLLPIEEKKLVRFEQDRRLVKFFGISATTIALVGAILLLPSYVLLLSYHKNLEQTLELGEAAAEKLQASELLAAAHTRETMIKDARAYLMRPPRAFALLDSFTPSDAPGVSVNSFMVQSGNMILINGFAASRHDLLNFEKKIRDANILQNLSFPVSNIVRSKDINFTMQGKLKPEHGL